MKLRVSISSIRKTEKAAVKYIFRMKKVLFLFSPGAWPGKEKRLTLPSWGGKPLPVCLFGASAARQVPGILL